MGPSGAEEEAEGEDGDEGNGTADVGLGGWRGRGGQAWRAPRPVSDVEW